MLRSVFVSGAVLPDKVGRDLMPTLRVRRGEPPPRTNGYGRALLGLRFACQPTHRPVGGHLPDQEHCRDRHAEVRE
jgi:hypothetical protein